jgi:hypothetical protein
VTRLATPDHLPSRLTTTLWDFSWYTQTAPGEPFHDLEAVFLETVERGYNTIRICAAPILLFGDHALRTDALRFANLGGEVGQKTRWYDARGGEVIDLKHRLVDLFRKANAHGISVIVSSWEFQQSSAFLEGPEWFEMLEAIPPAQRYDALARAQSKLLDLLTDLGLKETVAYVELHNEVDLSRFGTPGFWTPDDYWSQKDAIEKAIHVLSTAHPAILATVCFGVPPYLAMGSVSDQLGVAHHHVYAYGVLRELGDWSQLYGAENYPTPQLKTLLLPDAPPFEEYGREVEPWRLKATLITRHQLYAYDWADPIAWDRWLYRNYGRHELSMRQAIDTRLRGIALWADRKGIPVVIGEGWIGYTPLDCDFEDGPIGQDIAEYAVQRCADLGFWGTLTGSNRAPVHPAWGDIDFQRRLNLQFLEAPAGTPSGSTRK